MISSHTELPSVFHEVELVKTIEVELAEGLVTLPIGTIIYLDAEWQISEYDGFILQAWLDFSPDSLNSMFYVFLKEVNFSPILAISAYHALYHDTQPSPDIHTDSDPEAE